MNKPNQYAFDANGNKITWEQWYAEVRGENYEPEKQQFQPIVGSHALYVLPNHLQSIEAFEAQRYRGACDTGALGLEATPANNMGVSGKTEAPIEKNIELVVNDKGEILEVPLRHGHGDDASFVDWVNFSIGVETALRYTSMLSGLNSEACVMAISKRLEYIFGFGVTANREMGSNFYKESYDLGEKWGQVCIGGKQNDTVLIMVYGSGCTAAADGWEARLFTFLSEEALRPCITRVDLAFDDIEGQLYSVDKAQQDHLDGLFARHRKQPSGEKIGDWDFPRGKGRTKTIGNRKSGKYLRVYEKGMQLGCKFHPWVRVELEMKSTQMCIPFDVLLKAGAYLAASYPALEWISNEKADRPKTKIKTIEINANKAIEIVRNQFGNYINCLVQMFGYDNFLALVTRNDKIPERLNSPDFKYAPLSMHKEEYQYKDADSIVDLLDVPTGYTAPDVEYKYDSLLESWAPVRIELVKPSGTVFFNGQTDYESLSEFIKNQKSTYLSCPF